ncbi:hypothetical protein P700755_001216 [Psychroflexus torquis ATCC 700755]|uniref:Serine protease n=1 Tax=Psychroflexus torquis (strain ATCC 700755 / CIP 106069 / ACAM 623) TaxID=313595 RepID=K4ICL4_PSYTT|nr:serine protease [Psychroflexus torquis]AFU68154.1 hypothetical protein P700755_001216 [Psychroflexus torquis ATCC 700755]
MNLNDISTQLLYTTFPIWVERNNGEKSFGTGFIINHKLDDEKSVPLLVTNNHVIADAKQIITEFVALEGDKPPKINKIRVELSAATFLSTANKDLDLAIHPIAPLINQLNSNNTPVFYRTIDESIIPSKKQIEELSAIEDVTFIGYPSGLLDRVNLTPLIRRGITSSPIWNNFNGEQKFLIDAGVYPGSSGSPVFIFNQGSYGHSGGIIMGTRLIFVGILSESVIRKDENAASYFLGLGAVINSEAVSAYVKSFVDKNISKST